MTPAIAVEGSEPAVDTADVVVPVLVNNVIIEKGQEVVVHWSSSGLPKTKPKAKTLTWFDESERLAKKRRGI